MSELIQHNDNRATIRWKLLTGASALALTAYVASSGIAQADDADHPLIWIELGGQMEMQQGMSSPFVADFMNITPTPDVFKGFPFIESQREPRYSFGEDGKITFQPEGSDWSFSAGIRYGRSHSNRHTHRQLPPHSPVIGSLFFSPFPVYFTETAPLADTSTRNSDSHLVLDFSAGKDVGLGLFGHGGTSTISAGVRYASFVANSSALITGRPSITNIVFVTAYYGFFNIPEATFHQYSMFARAERSFKGIGPSLSWSASAPLAGNEQDGELTIDWGINAALLFGRQKAKVHQSTIVRHQTAAYITPANYRYHTYYPAPLNKTRSRNVTVPNVGAFAGLSYRYSDAKVSIGYRYDTFLNAMDTGIDTAKKSNITFNGPYASISIGLGD